MRYLLLLVTAAILTSATAGAQPLPPVCYSPDRLGWSGPSHELGCFPCCGCRGNVYEMQWQHRLEDAGWTTQPVSSITARYASPYLPLASLTHLERYCMRVRFADDAGTGKWGPSSVQLCTDAGSDLCFTWDSSPPTPPTLLDGGVVAGTNRVELHFAPSTDDGGGVARYRFRYLPGGASPAEASFGTATTSPVSDVLGAGTWTVAVFAQDQALNHSFDSAPMVVTLGFDASVAPPPAPSWPEAVTSDNYVELEWPDDGAESWVVTQRVPDGGWRIDARPRVSGLAALLHVPGPCQRHIARIARVIGDQVSDWSPPSAELLADTVDPVASPPTLVSFDGGSATISWSPASDGCASGMTYFVERSVNGGPWGRRGSTMGTQFVDQVTDTGQIRWRVVAEDGAGNDDESNSGANLFIEAPDAGIDAGTPDAGTPDAGAPDAGTTDAGVPDAGADDAGTGPQAKRTLLVGCGCDGGGSSVLLLLLLVWLTRSQRVGGFKIS